MIEEFREENLETENQIKEEDAAQVDPQAEVAAEEADSHATMVQELDETKDQLLRTLAELENVRKRTAAEKEDLRKYAVSGFAMDMLSILDNLNRALEASGKDAAGEGTLQQLVAGVELTRTEFDRALKKHGVEEVEATGQPFDSHVHQAVSEVESDQEPGTVVTCLQTGYKIKGRLLRPAMVTVARK